MYIPVNRVISPGELDHPHLTVASVIHAATQEHQVGDCHSLFCLDCLAAGAYFPMCYHLWTPPCLPPNALGSWNLMYLIMLPRITVVPSVPGHNGFYHLAIDLHNLSKHSSLHLSIPISCSTHSSDSSSE
jgi:hypothetical protein